MAMSQTAHAPLPPIAAENTIWRCELEKWKQKKKTFEIYDSNMTNMICVLKYKIGVCRRRRTCN